MTQIFSLNNFYVWSILVAIIFALTFFWWRAKIITKYAPTHSMHMATGKYYTTEQMIQSSFKLYDLHFRAWVVFFCVGLWWYFAFQWTCMGNSFLFPFTSTGHASNYPFFFRLLATNIQFLHRFQTLRRNCSSLRFLGRVFIWWFK